MYEHILDALQRRQYDEALAAAMQATVEDPASARAHQLLAMAQRATGRIEDAMASVGRAIELAPDDSDLHFQRAGLLMQLSDRGAAVESLQRSTELNPNQFGAYFLHAQVALGAGDVAEAERLARLMHRLDAQHPWVATINGSISLRKGNADAAVELLSDANRRHPEDPQVMHALGFAYLAKQHLAFAEQLFRRLLDMYPQSDPLRLLIGELLARQRRFDEALQQVQPLLAEGSTPSPVVQRFAGRLHLLLGRPEEALPLLRQVLAAMPADPLTLDLAMACWRRLDLFDDARAALDRLVDVAGHVDHTWRARLALEPGWDGATPGLLDRWRQAMPRSLPMLEARMEMFAALDQLDDAEEVARAIIALEPTHLAALGRIVDGLTRRDPGAALARVESLLANAGSPGTRRQYLHWLALTHDAAGNRPEAVETWTALHAEVDPTLVPPWRPSAAERLRSAEPVEPAGEPRSLFFFGAPGAGAELAAQVLNGTLPRFLADRYGVDRPKDPLQNINTIPALIEGVVDPADVAQDWRAWLPRRGISDGAVVDWLLCWDNILLDVVKPHIPGNRLVVVLRDPRDMLLDWLAFGAPAPIRFGSVATATAWLAAVLEQLRRLQDENLHDHRILRLDEVINDPRAMAGVLGAGMGTSLPVPPRELFRARRFPAGHWRQYGSVLGDSFAVLAPVAQALGYPAA